MLFDSGVRTGADIVKALALGADALLFVRPEGWDLLQGDRPRHPRVTRGAGHQPSARRAPKSRLARLQVAAP
ncbi:alpha-hydroxy-acid oxidizing protein [Micromonospora sp. BQ11]|uniref:alpha-hydroxy-acid oxidizing protein n=1 Tax=Micromonospora sp. BQ11 TaxID=3452212 RepID=UPI003F8B7C8F